MEASLSGKSMESMVLGFYSVISLDEIGFCGGYLVLNPMGRPQEFHCTLPIQPQRAQQILYGESLLAHLYADHLGPPLVAKAKLKADLVLINQPESLQLVDRLSVPVAYLRKSDDGKLQYKAANTQDREFVRQAIQGLNAIDWVEPFQRIQLAIEEAHAVRVR